jgi:hypothetical protein
MYYDGGCPEDISTCAYRDEMYSKICVKFVDMISNPNTDVFCDDMMDDAVGCDFCQNVWMKEFGGLNRDEPPDYEPICELYRESTGTAIEKCRGIYFRLNKEMKEEYDDYMGGVVTWSRI